MNRGNTPFLARRNQARLAAENPLYPVNKGGNPCEKDLKEQGIETRDFAVETEEKLKEQERQDLVKRGLELRAQGIHVRDFAVEAQAKVAARRYYAMKDRMAVQGIQVKDFAGEP